MFKSLKRVFEVVRTTRLENTLSLRQKTTSSLMGKSVTFLSPESISIDTTFKSVQTY